MKQERLIALSLWTLGLIATVNFLYGLKMQLIVSCIIGFLLQFALTKLETKIWGSGKKSGVLIVVSVAALIIDTILNAGGIYFYLKNVGDTNVALMFTDTSSIAEYVKLSIGTNNAIVAISLALGCMLALAPEAIDAG